LLQKIININSSIFADKLSTTKAKKMILGLIIFFVELSAYYGLIIFFIYKLFSWTLKQKKEKRIKYFYLGISIMIILFSSLTTYVIKNSSLCYDISKFENNLDIDVPEKYVLERRIKQIFGPEFQTLIELKIDRVDVLKIIQSANNSKVITLVDCKNGRYLFKERNSENDYYGGLDTKTGVLTLEEYHSVLIGIH
jgi:hypothetical protein